ncbi:carboxylesterase/lipase family protein [Altererythrobacter sp.]|uniref:carboxylesterase/lipase family protein n=1 Tax=Altererythrobacter sp. TaxID=1872480 RepID=UPI003CFC37AD
MRLPLTLPMAMMPMLLASCSPAVPSSGLTAEVPGGTISGKQIDGTTVFLGVPYAAPPVGDLRWKPPQSVVSWKGVRDGTHNAPACMQNDEGWNHGAWLRASEDCLTLDIHTPAMDGKAPVMVFIHGGAEVAGSADIMKDSSFPQQGVVGVDVQYRLGALGFLSHPALSAEQGGHSGNYAIMDLIAALNWVKANIADFGGDPDNITIFGESAGALNVSVLLAAPDARGLFHKAMMQSGNFSIIARDVHGYRSLADAEKIGTTFGELAQAKTAEELRRISPLAIMTLQTQAIDPVWGNLNWTRLTIDGKIVPSSPDELILEHPPIPVILGTNKAEFGPTDEAGIAAYSEIYFGENGAEALAAYRSEQADPRRGNLGLRLGSDQLFHCATDELADVLAKNGWPIWRYEYDIGPDGGLTAHALELSDVFQRREIGSGAHMQDYWAAFAITGDPNGKTEIGTDRPHWERWNTAVPQQLALSMATTGMEPGKPREAFCSFSDVE